MKQSSCNVANDVPGDVSSVILVEIQLDGICNYLIIKPYVAEVSRTDLIALFCV